MKNRSLENTLWQNSRKTSAWQKSWHPKICVDISKGVNIMCTSISTLVMIQLDNWWWGCICEWKYNVRFAKLKLISSGALLWQNLRKTSVDKPYSKTLLTLSKCPIMHVFSHPQYSWDQNILSALLWLIVHRNSFKLHYQIKITTTKYL